MTMRWFFLFLGVAASAAPLQAQRNSPQQTLYDSYDVLTSLESLPGRGIPHGLMNEAQAVVIIPRVIKAGFIFGGRGGHGVAFVRDKNKSWGEATFVNIGGASVGFQAGVSSTDLVLIFRNQNALTRILNGKGSLTLGADASIAAGPVGRQAEAGTNARLNAEIVSYSRSRGLFAGVALNGAVLHFDPNSNRMYQSDSRAETSRAADNIRAKLHEMGLPPGSVPPLPNSVPATSPPPANPTVTPSAPRLAAPLPNNLAPTNPVPPTNVPDRP